MVFYHSFNITPTTGELYLAASLDYENRTSFPITVTAIDNPDGDTQNTRSATVTITINVEDVNDNSPVFTKQVYEASVVENADVFSVMVTAEDRDSGQLVMYLLLSSLLVLSIAHYRC